MFTETSLNTKDRREKLTRIMFEEYSVPKFYLINRAVSSLFAIGRYTGLSLQSGYSGSVISPVVEAQVLPHAVLTNKLGGKDIS